MWCCTTQVERRVIKESALGAQERAGAREVYLIEEPLQQQLALAYRLRKSVGYGGWCGYERWYKQLK